MKNKTNFNNINVEQLGNTEQLYKMKTLQNTQYNNLEVSKEFNKYKTALYKKYGAVKSETSHEVKVLTHFGVLYISSEWSPQIKVANIHSRLEGDINKFIIILV